MQFIEMLFMTIGGLALFLYGMQKMSYGLKMAANERIRTVFSHLTRNRVIALLIGTGITALIQSSSATSVMTIGFVNAGLLTLKQAVSIILGANIGTTITAFIVSIVGKFKISTFALPAIGIGFYLRTFSKKRNMVEIGEIVLGLGLIFFGLDIMKDAFGPIKNSQATADFLASFSSNPVLGILVGTVVTMILQSSSATVAIVQLLAFNGVIPFDAAIPLILGGNIGTTITAQLASIGTNLNARRTAIANSLFNIIGVCIILPFVWLGLYGNFIESILPGEITNINIMVHIAVAHSIFNIIAAIIFAIALNLLLKAAISLTREKKEELEKAPKYLQERLIRNPSIALEQVIKELIRMAEIAKRTVEDAQKGFFNNDEKLLTSAADGEDTLDEFQQAITQYLVKISEKNLFTRESKEYPILLHSVNDLEKVGDYAKNIVRYAEKKSRNRLVLPDEGVEEINSMFQKLYELFDNVIDSLKSKDREMAMKAIAIEDQIDVMKDRCRENHINRMVHNEENPESGTMIMDLAINIEKMGDHLISIAKAVIKDLQWGKKISVPEEQKETPA